MFNPPVKPQSMPVKVIVVDLFLKLLYNSLLLWYTESNYSDFVLKTMVILLCNRCCTVHDCTTMHCIESGVATTFIQGIFPYTTIALYCP